MDIPEAVDRVYSAMGDLYQIVLEYGTSLEMREAEETLGRATDLVADFHRYDGIHDPAYAFAVLHTLWSQMTNLWYCALLRARENG